VALSVFGPCSSSWPPFAAPERVDLDLAGRLIRSKLVPMIAAK
jgi:hypothetical protein